MQETSTKGVQNLVWLGRNGDSLRTVQEIEITNKWYMHKPEPILENEVYKILKIQMDHLSQKTHLVLINKKK